MPYTDYSAEDFVRDKTFQRWITDPDHDTDAFWNDWLVKHPEKKATVEEARQMILLIKFGKNFPENERFIQVWKKLDEQWEINRQENTGHQPLKFFHRTWYKMAAVLTGLLICAIGFWIIDQNRRIRYTTPFGETKVVILPDSSRVTLNANSALEYPATWSGRNLREVWLEGEAFFDVRKDQTTKQSKFIVHTHSFDVEVLGTTFNVNNRHVEANVVLSSGSVKINPPDAPSHSIVMKPGELVELSAEQKTYRKIQVEPSVYTAWVNKQFVFKETSIREIADRIEAYYGLKVRIQNEELSRRTVTGRIPMGDIHLVLKLLSETFTIKITRQHDLILIENN